VDRQRCFKERESAHGIVASPSNPRPQHHRPLNLFTIPSVRDPHPPSERLLYAFSAPADLARWSVYSDAEFGGATTASLAASVDFPVRVKRRREDGCVPGEREEWGASPSHRDALISLALCLQGTADFAGVCAGTAGLGRAAAPTAAAPTAEPSTSTTATSPSPFTRRGGFAGISAVEAAGYLDLSPYDTLALRVRGDGRPYIASLRTENWLVGGRSHDVWQAFLFAPGDGAWTDVRIPLDRFLLTHRGRLVEARVEMNAARVISFGLGLANTASGVGGTGGSGGDAPAPATSIPPAPFRLGLDWVRAESVTRGVR